MAKHQYKSKALNQRVTVEVKGDYFTFYYHGSATRGYKAFVKFNDKGKVKSFISSYTENKKEFLTECGAKIKQLQADNKFRLRQLNEFIKEHKALVDKVHDAEIERDVLLEKLGL